MPSWVEDGKQQWAAMLDGICSRGDHIWLIEFDGLICCAGKITLFALEL